MEYSTASPRYGILLGTIDNEYATPVVTGVNDRGEVVEPNVIPVGSGTKTQAQLFRGWREEHRRKQGFS